MLTPELVLPSRRRPRSPRPPCAAASQGKTGRGSHHVRGPDRSGPHCSSGRRPPTPGAAPPPAGSPEPDDVKLERSAAEHISRRLAADGGSTHSPGWRCPCAQQRTLGRCRRAARRPRRRPARRWSPSMFWVIQGGAGYQLLQPHQGEVRRVRLRAQHGLPTHPAPVPDQRRIPLERLRGRQVLRTGAFAQSPVSDVAERRQPALRAHARAGEHRHVAGPLQRVDQVAVHGVEICNAPGSALGYRPQDPAVVLVGHEVQQPVSGPAARRGCDSPATRGSAPRS